MGRKRIIDQGKVLDAAEIVVQRDGVGGFTLEAVAKEAGISKASVLYDYKSKDALIGAIFLRHINEQEQRLAAFMAEYPDDPEKEFKGRMALADDIPLDKDRAVCMALCVSMARDKKLKEMLADFIRKDMHTICEESIHKEGALLAFLALHGFLSMEFFDFYNWPSEERQKILRQIEWLYRQVPVVVEKPESANTETSASKSAE